MKAARVSVVRQDSFWWALADHPGRGSLSRVVVLDRFGDVALDQVGEPVIYGPTLGRDELTAAVDRHTRHLGPMSLPPTVWVLTANQLIELSSGDIATTVSEIVAPLVDGDAALVLVTKEH